MPAPSVTIRIPPPTTYFAPGILRPEAKVTWTGGVGPFDVVHEWDTVSTFDSVNLVQDTNAGATSPDTGVPPSDLGPAGTPWFYRARVTDTSDSAEAQTQAVELTFLDPASLSRFLYAPANAGVAFHPTDVDLGDPGPADPDTAADGEVNEFSRFLYAPANVGVAFHPTDVDKTTPGPADPDTDADGDTSEFSRFLATLANVGVGFDPTDTPAEGWDPEETGDPLIGPGDGFTPDFDRFLHALANVTDATPTPHIWYLFPSFGREGWEFVIVGYGFGDTQAEYAGSATLAGQALGVLSWELVAQSSADLTIDPIANVAEPIHQEVRTTVPAGAESGLVIVCTDGP